jgi:trans-aconitate methyltransferase
MSNAGRKSHWDNVYGTKDETDVSWFQATPAPSLDLLKAIGASAETSIIDIGGGASRLVDALLSENYRDVTVLDLSEAALAASKVRLGTNAGQVTWIVADITTWSPPQQYDIWHDRAAFHFLTERAEQDAYVGHLKQALRVGGHAIIGTFAPDGPEKCSGLPVMRHDARSLAALLGPGFDLLDDRRHDHQTPWNSVQHFQFSTFQRKT